MTNTGKLCKTMMLLSLVFVLASFVQVSACDITFEVVGTKKDVYKAGDEAL